MDWGKLPDLAAVTLLASAFAAVARRSHTPVSTLWLIGWVMIAVHFASDIFAPATGQFGAIATFIALASLAWAGMLFNWASVPDRNRTSSLWMLCIMIGTNTLYLALVVFSPDVSWALTLAAILLGALPLILAFRNVGGENHPLRWATVASYCLLSVFLLAFQNRSGNGLNLAVNALLFTVYFGCCVHFWFAYGRATSGAFVTVLGFFAWSFVFAASPAIDEFLPNLHLESEVWNLPKYIVAVGMILLLLEDQIEHNKYLALHDELTGLPNRRLFQDRLATALERARRTEAHAALLLVDLDQFKLVNDTYGHHAGDRLLEYVGNVFSGRVRRSDTVARTGGDEFAIILDDPINRIDAERVSRSLIELLRDPLVLGDKTIQIGASVGIALFPDDATDAEGLCIAADLRMYDFKHRNGHFVSPTRPPTVVPLPAFEATARLQGADSRYQ